MKVTITVVLELDASTREEFDKIIQEMDYNFSYVEVDETVGKQLIEVDRVTSMEITDAEIIEF